MTDITHPQLVSALVKAPRDILSTLSEHSIDLWHAATGIAGEGGELLEAIMLGQGFRNAVELAEMRGNAVEELGDLEFYMEQLRQRTGLTRDDTISAGGALISPDMLGYHAADIAVQGCNILDTVKKCSIYNKELDLKLLDIQLAKLDMAMDALRLALGIPREETLVENIRKLSKRYEGLKYSDKGAHERADKIPERKFFGQEPAVGTPVTAPLSPPPSNPEE